MFRHPVAILPADIDHMGHVNNAVYLKWVQDAVVDYWSSVAPPGAVAAHLWVALKHEITFLKPTFLQDKVVAEVIAEKVEGARAFFHTVLAPRRRSAERNPEHLVLPRRGDPAPGAAGARYRRRASCRLQPRRASIPQSRRALPPSASAGVRPLFAGTLRL